MPPARGGIKIKNAGGKDKVRDMKKILFQGDSITDAGRLNQEDPGSFGSGYANLLACRLMYEDRENKVYNCGISGNRVVDLYARWKKDCLNLEPDILTILIGVNDVWHEIDFKNGVEAPKFERVYRMLLEETMDKLPGIEIILMGAYLLPGTATGGEIWESFSEEVKKRSNITKKLAQELGLYFIDLQSAFDEALKKAPAEHWSYDGVHPTAAGHELIKRRWLELYEKIK